MCGVERDAPVYPHSRTLTRPLKKREMYGTGDWEMWLPGPLVEEEGVVGREEVGMEGICDARFAVLGEVGRQGNLSFFFSYFFFSSATVNFVVYSATVCRFLIFSREKLG